MFKDISAPCTLSNESTRGILTSAVFVCLLLVHHHQICLLLHYEHQHAPSDRKSIKCEALYMQQKEKLELRPRRSSAASDASAAARAKKHKNYMTLGYWYPRAALIISLLAVVAI
jgi:putative heme iron utilization protein